MSVTRMLIGGEWRDAGSGRTEDITSPYDGSVVGTVPRASQDDVEAAITAAEVGAVTWRRTPAHERMRILLRLRQRAHQLDAVVAGRPGGTTRGPAALPAQASRPTWG